MKCSEFERLLADALGDEMSHSDRLVFEEHVCSCDRCRKDYESARVTLGRLRALSVAESGTVDVSAIRASGVARRASFLRYAASILVAFAAGYAVAGWNAQRPDATERRRAAETKSSEGLERYASASFGAALTEAFRERPGGSELSKCLAAMYGRR
jgi:predicted anti-sigma-YlaC factor YlaD